MPKRTLTADERMVCEQLAPTVVAGINGLHDADWRLGMSEESLVTPIVMATILDIASRLPLETFHAALDAGSRCPSCDHVASMHQPDGCWHTVTVGTADRNLGCPCSVPRDSLRS